ATELADVLARDTETTFPVAHRVVATLVRQMKEQGRPLTSASPADVEAAGGPQLDAEVLAAALDPAGFVRRRSGLGMPAPQVMEQQLVRAQERLEGDLVALRDRSQALRRATAQLRGSGKEQVKR